MYYGRGGGGRTPRGGTNVHTNHRVAAAWMNQAMPGAKSNNGNFWFEDRTLYSYETPIGVITDARDPDGKRVIIMTSETFSVTTSGKHEAAARHAFNDGTWRRFFLPYVDFDPVSCEMNLAWLLSKYDKVVNELMETRWSSFTYYLRNTDPFTLRHLDAPIIRRGKVVGSYPYVECESGEVAAHVRERMIGLFVHAWEFAKAFDLPTVRKDVDADVDTIMAVRRRREIAYWHPTKVRARTTHYARDLMRQIVR